MGRTLKHLNGGFFVARVATLKKLFILRDRLERDGVLEPGKVQLGSKIMFGRTDQGVAALLMEKYPHLIVLDYAAALVNNMFRMPMRFAWQEGQSAARWVHKDSGHPVCFFHNNGNVDVEASGFRQILDLR